MRIAFWLQCARAYSLPVTIMSWLVAFAWSLKAGGNVLAGVLTMFGIACAHLSTNLFDDYFDYKVLSCNPEYLSSAQNCKCAFIKEGKASHGLYLKLALFFAASAAAVGAVLTVIAGWKVLLLAAAGVPIVLLYSPLSRLCLGEAAVLFAFGPLLFEGVYYVMTGGFSADVLLLSLSVVMISEGLIYTHMLLDTEGDLVAHKRTLCAVLGPKAPLLLYIFYIAGFALAGALALKTGNHFIFTVFLVLPFVLKLCIDLHTKDHREHFFPLFCQARNIITYFALLMTAAILLKH